MTAKELRELSAVDLEKQLRDARQDLMMMRLRRPTGQVEKTHTIRQRRKDIARMETILTQKRTTAAAPEAARP